MRSARGALLWLTLACAAPLACAEGGSAAPAAPATSAELPPLHFAATVPGGAHMQPLRCATPTRTPIPWPSAAMLLCGSTWRA